MKKKQNLIEFSRLNTRELIKRLEKLEIQIQKTQNKIINGKTNQTSTINQLKIQIAQIKTLINQRILEENEKQKMKKQNDK